MDDKVKPGDDVEWRSDNAPIDGEVVMKLERETRIAGLLRKSSKGGPQYLVESGKVGEGRA